MQKRTQAELDQLKRDWADDRSWDLEDTEGFEAHRDELASYRAAREAEWAKAREAQIAAGMEKFECSKATFLFIERMQTTLKELTARLDEHGERLALVEHETGVAPGMRR